MASPTAWEIRIAWLLRAALVATALAHIAGGDPLYGTFCLAAVGLTLVPAALAQLTLGLGALWEIGEYAIDHVLARATQGAPGMAALDDTMWDLMLDGAGGLLGGLLGAIYMSRSRESRRRIEQFARLLQQRGLKRRRRPSARPAAV